MEDATGHLEIRKRAINQTRVNGMRHSGHEQKFMSNGFHHLEARRMLVFSSQDENGIKRLESAYNDHWSRMNEDDFDDSYMSRLSYTLSNRRSAFSWKSFATVNSKNDLMTGIKFSRPIRAFSRARLAFCFTGQGAQWYAMGREIQAFVFRQSLREISELLKEMGCLWSLQGTFVENLCRLR